jgi:hypothetical protein
VEAQRGRHDNGHDGGGGGGTRRSGGSHVEAAIYLDVKLSSAMARAR